MTPREAATVVRAVAQALRNDPNQFAITVNVIGQQITSHGGTGLSLNVTGGVGGTTVGQHVTASAGSLSIEQGRVSSAVQARLSDLATAIDEIANELEAPAPNTSSIWARAKALGQGWSPGIIQSVLGNLLTLTLVSP